uniref:ABC1 atypical kinase-like domain-containing protein n=1 Tax=Salix viminalis TaxID=40686 RepID=A0A6N2K465_SALVM
MARAVNASVYSPEDLAVLRRTLEILTAAGSFGLKLFLDKRNGVFDQKKRKRAAELRRIFTRLGPTFVKLGQGLSTRPDICPPEYLEELAELQTLKHFRALRENWVSHSTRFFHPFLLLQLQLPV